MREDVRGEHPEPEEEGRQNDRAAVGGEETRAEAPAGEKEEPPQDSQTNEAPTDRDESRAAEPGTNGHEAAQENLERGGPEENQEHRDTEQNQEQEEIEGSAKPADREISVEGDIRSDDRSEGESSSVSEGSQLRVEHEEAGDVRERFAPESENSRPGDVTSDENGPTSQDRDLAEREEPTQSLETINSPLISGDYRKSESEKANLDDLRGQDGIVQGERTRPEGSSSQESLDVAQNTSDSADDKVHVKVDLAEVRLQEQPIAKSEMEQVENRSGNRFVTSRRGKRVVGRQMPE